MLCFLHERGYDFFTIPKLTYGEIGLLIDIHNRGIKIAKENAKKTKRMGRKARRR